MNEPYLKMLALADSPTSQTGFARVGQNLLPRWLKRNGGPFDQIDVWAINYRGEVHDWPFWIYDAGNGTNWQSAGNLGRLITTLGGKNVGQAGRPPYTHLWMIQDSFCLSNHKFPDGLKLLCEKLKIRTVYYMPVDAPQETEWMEIVKNVDAAICYTDYGKAEALKALPGTFNPAAIGVIPHGCDTNVYRPITNRIELRRALFRPASGQAEFLSDDDFLIVNVNANQRRKDVPRTMRILKALKEEGRKKKEEKKPSRNYKLMLHMPKESSDGVKLDKVGRQLGLEEGVDWMCSDQFFTFGFASLPEQRVAEIYNAADLMLTTTLGEGWGFCLTEALACGCPIAAPEHTSCKEIMDSLAPLCHTPILPLKVEPFGTVNAFDNSRFRSCVNVEAAVETIASFAERRGYRNRMPLTDEVKIWLSWDRIAKEWEKVLVQGRTETSQIAAAPAVIAPEPEKVRML